MEVAFLLGDKVCLTSYMTPQALIQFLKKMQMLPLPQMMALEHDHRISYQRARGCSQTDTHTGFLIEAYACNTALTTEQILNYQS